MGSEANAKLFYGIYWDECESIFKDEREDIDFDPDEFNEALQKKFPDLLFEAIYCYETSYCLCIPETSYSGDWDDITEIDLEKLNISKEDKYKNLFIDACEKFGMNYKEPKLSMKAHYW